MPSTYEFIEAEFEYADIEPDPTDKTVTKLLKIISVERTPGGRLARIGLTVTKGKPRDIEVLISESIARAFVKVFDDDESTETR